jgi:hypothetical protein
MRKFESIIVSPINAAFYMYNYFGNYMVGCGFIIDVASPFVGLTLGTERCAGQICGLHISLIFFSVFVWVERWRYTKKKIGDTNANSI